MDPIQKLQERWWGKQASDWPKFWDAMHKVLKRSTYDRPDTMGGRHMGRGYLIEWNEAPNVTTEAIIHEGWAEVEGQKYRDPRKAAQAVIDALDWKWEEKRGL